MNCLQKELFEQNGKARILRFYNVKSGKTVSYKVYDNKRRYVLSTDDVDYARKTLNEKGENK